MTNLVFFIKRSLATRFEQIKSVHYQAISHTENQNLLLFLRSKELRKITKN